MDPRKAKYASLCARVKEMPEHAIEKAYGTILVVVPHHDYCSDFSKIVLEEFLDFGYAVDAVTNHSVHGDEFSVLIRSISAVQGGMAKGRSFHAVYLPTVDGLTNSQRHTLAQMKQEMSHVFHYASIIVEY